MIKIFAYLRVYVCANTNERNELDEQMHLI
jgi:transcription initiation factor IIE alpha subunit